MIKPGTFPLDEIRGMVMADYQSYLEDQWVSELKKKHRVVMNDNALEQLYEKE